MASGVPLDRFLAQFVAPLVSGGAVHVDGLIGPGLVKRLVDEPLVDATLLARVTDRTRQHLARIGPASDIGLLPPDAIALAAVWHNLLAMTHPELAGRRGLFERVRTWSEQMLEWVGPARTSHEVALRHGVLSQLGTVGRVDTEVTFWAGSARYLGVPPPSRLMVLPTVRRVQETRTRVGFFDLVHALQRDTADCDLLPTARLALALSPLTDLALVQRVPPFAFEWTPFALDALGDAPLRGAAVRVVCARDGAREASDELVAARVRTLEAATRRCASSALPSAAARVLVAFHLALLVDESLGRDRTRVTGHALAWDCVARLGAHRVARLLGMERAALDRALSLDDHVPAPSREAPSRPLLLAAGLLES